MSYIELPGNHVNVKAWVKGGTVRRTCERTTTESNPVTVYSLARCGDA